MSYDLICNSCRRLMLVGVKPTILDLTALVPCPECGSQIVKAIRSSLPDAPSRWTDVDLKMLEAESKTLVAQQAILKMKLDQSFRDLKKITGDSMVGHLLYRVVERLFRV